MALLEVSVCRKAHYGTEFFYLLRREQLGQLLGAAGTRSRYIHSIPPGTGFPTLAA